MTTELLKSYMLLRADPVLLLFDALAQWEGGTGSLAEVRRLAGPVRKDMAAALTDGRTGFEDDQIIADLLEQFRLTRARIEAGITTAERLPVVGPALAGRRHESENAAETKG